MAIHDASIPAQPTTPSPVLATHDRGDGPPAIHRRRTTSHGPEPVERGGAPSQPVTAHDESHALVLRHAPLVRRIARQVTRGMGTRTALDDLIQCGMLGLLDAAATFDETRGASFETHLEIRVRGAMLDELRRDAWAPRSLRRKLREVSEATRAIESETGRDARDHEISGRLGITLDAYHRTLRDASTRFVASLEDLADDSSPVADESVNPFVGPDESLERDQARAALAKALSTLPEREQIVMKLHHFEEFTLREIGDVLGVTESRACQLHSQAVMRLQSRIAPAGDATRVTARG